MLGKRKGEDRRSSQATVALAKERVRHEYRFAMRSFDANLWSPTRCGWVRISGLAFDVWSDVRSQDLKKAASNARANAATATQLGARDTGSVVGGFSANCFATPGARHLPPIIRHFQNHYPDVRLMIREGDPVKEVERGTLDLALIYDMDLARQVVLHTIGE